MPENTIWFLLNSLIKSLKILHFHKFPHSDIQPRTVHLGKHGKVKILNNFFLTNKMDGYSKMLISGGEYKSTLSPILLRDLEFRKIKPTHEPILSDIWSVGMTVMCACTNENFEKFYDWERFMVR